MTLKFSGKNGINPILIILTSVVLSVVINQVIAQKIAPASSGNSNNVISYIEDNADKVVEAINKYYQNKAQQGAANRNENLSKNLPNLYSSDTPSVGDSNAKVKVVEFFDYNCGYCKKAFSAISKVLDDDLGVQFFFKDLPILGASSALKAQASVAANLINPKKYLEMHDALLEVGSISTAEEAADIASKLGYDREKFISKINSDEVNDIISANRKLATDLNINGTPAFIINDKFVDRGLSYSSLKQHISNANNSN